ncbi:TetR family transcriptional regulator [Epidermidibacterium keratini]|uniref:TetR family transcriptional regulator n=1 Tax=Epidermidibacterium keratini TaxID=1891644 RepID=A0A7M3T532_9ACTN|nr:TetR/AcrR family transcriptional regulator [Epidermidibacterium keratini]QHB98893.1 TetR family transcriptional regulator [Epidermidibacterium keratini]
MSQTGVRAAQRMATRERIVSAAIDVLRSNGVAATSTLEVQKAAGVSRGALLHHFPTRKDLVRALIDELVRRNEAVVDTALATAAGDDQVGRAVHALWAAAQAESALLEMDLWHAARSDDELRTALIDAERAAGRDLTRVVARAFGVEYAGNPRLPLVTSMTLALIRGLSTGQVLRTSTKAANQAIDQWVSLAHELLNPTAKGSS